MRLAVPAPLLPGAGVVRRPARGRGAGEVHPAAAVGDGGVQHHPDRGSAFSGVGAGLN